MKPAACVAALVMLAGVGAIAVPATTASAAVAASYVPPSESASWAGWVAAGSGPYQAVEALWQMPANTGTTPQAAETVFWIGFDGDTASPGNIEQCGVRMLENPEGLIGYSAFYETSVQAGSAKSAPIAVYAGDYVSAVAEDTGGSFQCALSVQHNGVTHTWGTGLIEGSFPFDTAEVITEAPGYKDGIPMVPFGTVHYYDVDLGTVGYAYPVTIYTSIDGFSLGQIAVYTSPLSGAAGQPHDFYNQYIRSELGP